MEPPPSKRRKLLHRAQPPSLYVETMPDQAPVVQQPEPPTSSTMNLQNYVQRRQQNQDEYQQVCVINQNVPNRMQRLRSLARALNVPVTRTTTADQLCRQISQVLTPSVFATLPTELIEEIQLHLPSRSVQAMRSAIPEVVSTAPSTLQWIYRYWNPLHNTGMVLSRHRSVTNVPQGTISFFDDLSNRAALEYLLSTYPLFFSDVTIPSVTAPTSIVDDAAAADGIDYSYFPGQRTKLFPNFQYEPVFVAEMQEAYAESDFYHQPAVIVTAIPTTVSSDSDNNNNNNIPMGDTTTTTSIRRGLNNHDRMGVMRISVVFDKYGGLEYISEHPSDCTPGFADVESLRQNSNERDMDFYIEYRLYSPGEYERLLKQANPAVWQRGLYPPPSTEYISTMYADHLDQLGVGSLAFFEALFERWTDQGYVFAYLPWMFNIDTGLFCFSKSEIATTFISAANKLKLWQWGTLSKEQQRERVAQVWPIVLDALMQWRTLKTSRKMTGHGNNIFPDSLYTLQGFAIVVLIMMFSQGENKDEEDEDNAIRIDTHPFIRLAFLASQRYQQPYIRLPDLVMNNFWIRLTASERDRYLGKD